MRGTRAKELRRWARMIANNEQYKGIPFKTIYKDLKRRYKANVTNGVGGHNVRQQ